MAGVIEAHGYPPLTAGDLVDLRQALYTLLYAPASPTEATSAGERGAR